MKEYIYWVMYSTKDTTIERQPTPLSFTEQIQLWNMTFLTIAGVVRFRILPVWFDFDHFSFGGLRHFTRYMCGPIEFERIIDILHSKNGIKHSYHLTLF